jgi:hypothetical protein
MLLHSRDAWTSVVPTGVILSALSTFFEMATQVSQRLLSECCIQHSGPLSMRATGQLGGTPSPDTPAARPEA